MSSGVRRLDQDLEGATEIIEVVDVLRTEIELQGGEHVRRSEADLFRLQAIDVCVQERRSRVVEREYAAEGRILVRCHDQLVCRVRQSLGTEVVAVLQHQLEPAGAAEALDRRRLDDEDVGVLDDGETLAHFRQHLGCVHALDVLAIKRGQRQEVRRGVRRVGRRGRVEAGDRRGVFDAGGLQDDVVYLAEHLVGPREARARRQLHDAHQVADVLIRNEAGRHSGELQAGERDQADVGGQHDRAGAHQAARHLAVFRGHPFEAGVEVAEPLVQKFSDPARLVVSAVMRLEQHGT